jgi:hypothetical protein
MEIVEPTGGIPVGWRRVVVAEHQEDYLPMPSLIGYNFVERPHLSRWKLTWKERLRVLIRGELWMTLLTFGAPIRSEPQTPVMLDVERPTWTRKAQHTVERLYP